MNRIRLISTFILMIVLLSTVFAQSPSYYIKKDNWQETVFASMQALAEEEKAKGGGVSLDLAQEDFTISLWVKTSKSAGRIFLKSIAPDKFEVGSKSLMISEDDGSLVWLVRIPREEDDPEKQTDESFFKNFAIALGRTGEKRIYDGQWHHIAMSTSNLRYYFYMDGEPLTNLTLWNFRKMTPDNSKDDIFIGSLSIKINEDDSSPSFIGQLDEVQIFNGRLSDEEIKSLSKDPSSVKNGLAGWWSFDDNAEDKSPYANHGEIHDGKLTEGKFGQCWSLDGSGYVRIPAISGKNSRDQILELTKRDFSDSLSLSQIAMEVEDGIWNRDLILKDKSALASRYVAATRPILGLDEKAKQLEKEADSEAGLRTLREVYYKSRSVQDEYDALTERMSFVQEEVAYLSTEHSSDEVRWNTYTNSVDKLANSVAVTVSEIENGNDKAVPMLNILREELEMLHDTLPHKLPSGPAGPSEFGAVYAKLKYTLDWDRVWRVSEDADVVVNFDDVPYKFVFWRGCSYIPAWATEHNGPWFTNEFFERRGWLGGGKSMMEPMSDKQCRYSHVRVIENNPARVVVHWRYNPTDLDYNLAYIDPATNWGDWADEYWYIYPDGIAMREATLMSTGPNEDWVEYQESIFINQPGTKPSDNIPQEAVTLVNLKGETHTYKWERKFPSNFDKLADPVIQYVNFRTKYTQFSVVSPEELRVSAYPKDARFKDDEYFNTWDAWPVSQDWSDARKATNFNKVSHSNLTHIVWKPFVETPTKRTWLMLTGMTDHEPQDLTSIAKSWLYPPDVSTNSKNFRNNGYSKPERAYKFVCEKPNDPGSLEMRIAASESSPIINLSLMVEDWGNKDVKLFIDGNNIPQSKDFRVGYRKDFVANDLIVYLNIESTKPVELELVPAK